MFVVIVPTRSNFAKMAKIYMKSLLYPLYYFWKVTIMQRILSYQFFGSYRLREHDIFSEVCQYLNRRRQKFTT